MSENEMGVSVFAATVIQELRTDKMLLQYYVKMGQEEIARLQKELEEYKDASKEISKSMSGMMKEILGSVRSELNKDDYRGPG